MKSEIIAIVGISGVGKTTFIDGLKTRFDFQHLSAGTLIGAEKKRRMEDIERDSLRLSDIAINQELLINGFLRAKDERNSLIVLDGHTVIDTPQGLKPIPTDVFGKLGVQGFIFLKASPSVILAQRDNDQLRDRPLLTIDQISDQQERALCITQEIGLELGIPCEVVKADQSPELFTNLRPRKA